LSEQYPAGHSFGRGIGWASSSGSPASLHPSVLSGYQND
jgi:hypothetical protein